MIRVSILAETEDEARQLAALFADDEVIEVIGTLGPAIAHSEVSQLAGLLPDAALVAGRALISDLPFENLPVVLLDDDRASSDGWWDPAKSVYACLPAGASPREIVAALLAASQGLTLLTAEQAELAFQISVPRTPSRPAPSAPVPVFYETLTPRELQVLRMMAEGFGNKEIAGHLHISDHTAKFHVASILGKLHAQTRTEAVTIGIRTGLVPV